MWFIYVKKLTSKKSDKNKKEKLKKRGFGMIRYYEKEDIEQIAKLIDEDWKIEYRGMIDDEYLNNLNYKDREKRIRDKYNKEKSIVYDDNGVIKGFCRFGENRSKESNLAEIYALYVKNDNRRMGIGQKLIKRAKEILRKRGYKEVILWCLKENKNGRNFYEKVGGKLYKERLFKIGDIYYDEVSYKYNLEEE